MFISVRDNDKRAVIPLAWEIHDLGYQVCSTRGTGSMLQANGIPAEIFGKVQDQSESVLDHLEDLAFVINTPNNRGARTDEGRIRSACAVRGLPCFTTLAAATALVGGLRQQAQQDYAVRSLQELLSE